MNEEMIARCPFCRGDGACVELDDDGYAQVLCVCTANGPLRKGEAEAIAAWNAAYNPNERLPELTDAMLEAGATAFCETQSLDPRKMTKVVYAAMMKAAPPNPNERLREAERIEQVCKDMEYAIAGGMSWISHDECVGFVRQLRKIESALSSLPQGEDT